MRGTARCREIPSGVLEQGFWSCVFGVVSARKPNQLSAESLHQSLRDLEKALGLLKLHVELVVLQQDLVHLIGWVHSVAGPRAPRVGAG